MLDRNRKIAYPMNMIFNQSKDDNMEKLPPRQHSEMKSAYRAFNCNRSYSPTVHAVGKTLYRKGMIATSPIGNGLLHTGLTRRGLEYCREFFPLFERID